MMFLGTFQFQDFEVPEHISFGGENMITKHKLSGGRKVFDVMGTDEDDIKWSGILGLTTDLDSRVEELQTLRRAGQSIPLSFSNYYFTVIVKDIKFPEYRFGRANYTITLCVVDDQTQSSNDDQDLGDAVDGDLSSAILNPITSTLQDVEDFAGMVQSALAPVQAIAGAVVSLTGGSTAALAVLQATEGAQSVISGVAGVANASLSALGSLPVIAGGLAAGAWVNSVTTLATQVSQIDATSNYVGRVISNLSN
jgi:hypothetical protein